MHYSCYTYQLDVLFHYRGLNTLKFAATAEAGQRFGKPKPFIRYVRNQHVLYTLPQEVTIKIAN